VLLRGGPAGGLPELDRGPDRAGGGALRPVPPLSVLGLRGLQAPGPAAAGATLHVPGNVGRWESPERTTTTTQSHVYDLVNIIYITLFDRLMNL